MLYTTGFGSIRVAKAAGEMGGGGPVMHQTGHTRIYCATLACIRALWACLVSTGIYL